MYRLLFLFMLCICSFIKTSASVPTDGLRKVKNMPTINHEINQLHRKTIDEKELHQKTDSLPINELNENDSVEARTRTRRRHGNRKQWNYSELMLPTLILPGVLFSSFLPFIIPMLKVAAVLAAVVNNAALMAGVLYLAKQKATEQETGQSIYFNPGFNRRLIRA